MSNFIINIINSLISKYHLFDPSQTYRGRRNVFVTQNDPR